MKKFSSILLIAALVVLLGSRHPAHAQVVKYAQAGMAFLKIDVGTRSAAMGGTEAAVTGSVEAMFSNPAGLAMLEGGQVMSSVNNWIANIKHYGIGAAYNIDNIGTFGISLVSMDYGTFTRTVPYSGFDPQKRIKGYINQGTFTVTEYAVGISYARQIATRFYVGGNLKYAHQDLGQVEIFDPLAGTTTTAEARVSNIVLDFGTMYYTGFKDLRFGVTIHNFSNQSDYFDQRFELPLTFDFGVAMDLLMLVGGESPNSLTLAVDAVHPRDYSERIHVGMEYAFQDMLFLRGGYKFNYSEQSLTAGAGVNVGVDNFRLKAGYAYTAFGRFFGAVHRVSLGIGIQ